MSKKNLLLIIVFSFLGLAVVSEIAYYYLTANRTPPLTSNSTSESAPFIPQPLTSPLPATKVPDDFDKIDFVVNKLRIGIDNSVLDSANISLSFNLSLGEVRFSPKDLEGLTSQLSLIDGNTGFNINYLPEDLDKISVFLNQNNQITPISISDLIPGDQLTIKPTYNLLLDNPTVESVTIYAER